MIIDIFLVFVHDLELTGTIQNYILLLYTEQLKTVFRILLIFPGGKPALSFLSVTGGFESDGGIPKKALRFYFFEDFCIV